jgi:uncharacterized membrane-anchored protein
MDTTATLLPSQPSLRQMLNKVPEITLYFWLIKCLCTTIGETLSDNATTTWAGGDSASVKALDSASLKVMLITMGVLAILLAIQFTRRRYVASVYWACIVVISLVGTQITDQFEGNGDQPNNMWAITIVSITLLGLVFLVWWLVERTLSMHSIRTYRREAFYWLAILVTFATGTAVGDLIAEKFSLGYLTTLLLFVAIIAIIAATWRFTAINAVLAFWLAYIMTRPLGASTGDWLSQKGNQGLNLGTAITSYIFLVVIVCLVIFLQIRKPDITPVEVANADPINHPHLPHPHLPHPHLPHPHLPQHQHSGHEFQGEVRPAPQEG